MVTALGLDSSAVSLAYLAEAKLFPHIVGD